MRLYENWDIVLSFVKIMLDSIKISSPLRWPDVVAGLSLAGLLIPEAVAYASIGHLPPQAGVMALMAGLLVFGVLGTSRLAIVSATSSSAAVLAAATAALTGGDVQHRLQLAMGLVMVTGVFLCIAALLRLGNLTDFVARPVLRGFTFGLALIVTCKQIASIVGIAPPHTDLPSLVFAIFASSAAWHGPSLCVGGAAWLLLKLLAPYRQLPGALVTILLGILIAQWPGFGMLGIKHVGQFALDLSLPRPPELSRAEWLRLGELGFAMVLVLYSESYGSIRSLALKHGDATTPNRDMLALGLANCLSGLLQGMPVGAGYSASSANEAAGGRSRWAGLCALIVVVLVVFSVLPLLTYTPEPVLAAIVIHALSQALNPSFVRTVFRWQRDRLLLLVSIASVLILGVLDGLLLSIAISLILALQRFSESAVSTLGRLGNTHNFVDTRVHPEAEPVAGLLILRPEAQIFFANVERILSQIRSSLQSADSHLHAVIISLEETADLDSSSLESLRDFFQEQGRQGRPVYLARLKHPVHEALNRLGQIAGVQPILLGLSVDDAVALALQPEVSKAHR